jgi:p-cumate 2,3-dioxygenase beta subunit
MNTGVPFLATNVQITDVTREMVENFLFLEAQLLDEWRLDEWEALLDDDARYLVPSNDCTEGDPRGSLYLIADDRERLHQRVLRLKSPDCHAEYPPSRTCRMISNVRIEGTEDDLVRVAANFTCHRFRRYDRVYPFVGHYRFVLRYNGGDFKIQERKVILASEELGTLGSVSFIL